MKNAYDQKIQIKGLVPPKINTVNANLAIRIRPDQKSLIKNCADQQGLSTNRFMVDATLSIIDMINGKESGKSSIFQSN